MHPHYYAGLDKDSKMAVELPLREVAERVVEMNYGTHRFLSHLVDVRRERLAARVAHYRELGDENVAQSVERRGDPLADAIEKQLHEEQY